MKTIYIMTVNSWILIYNDMYLKRYTAILGAELFWKNKICDYHFMWNTHTVNIHLISYHYLRKDGSVETQFQYKSRFIFNAPSPIIFFIHVPTSFYSLVLGSTCRIMAYTANVAFIIADIPWYSTCPMVRWVKMCPQDPLLVVEGVVLQVRP